MAGQLGLALQQLPEGPCDLSRALRGVGPPLHASHDSGVLWADTDAWGSLCRVVPGVARKVAESWRTEARATNLAMFDVDTDADAKSVGPAQRWLMRAEEFLAMHVLLVVRELLSRLANVFFYVILAVMLIVALQQSFPFEPRQALLAMAWVYVVSAVVLVLTIVVQMEHDAVLSAFSSTKSGALNWDTALWSRVFIYGIIPLASVFAAQFPGIGTTILDWLTPVQKALP
jgi:hypothetical protein